jgi:hypothetical protein
MAALLLVGNAKRISDAKFSAGLYLAAYNDYAGAHPRR